LADYTVHSTLLVPRVPLVPDFILPCLYCYRCVLFTHWTHSTFITAPLLTGSLPHTPLWYAHALRTYTYRVHYGWFIIHHATTYTVPTQPYTWTALHCRHVYYLHTHLSWFYTFLFHHTHGLFPTLQLHFYSFLSHTVLGYSIPPTPLPLHTLIYTHSLTHLSCSLGSLTCCLVHWTTLFAPHIFVLTQFTHCTGHTHVTHIPTHHTLDSSFSHPHPHHLTDTTTHYLCTHFLPHLGVSHIRCYSFFTYSHAVPLPVYFVFCFTLAFLLVPTLPHPGSPLPVWQPPLVLPLPSPSGSGFLVPQDSLAQYTLHAPIHHTFHHYHIYHTYTTHSFHTPPAPSLPFGPFSPYTHRFCPSSTWFTHCCSLLHPGFSTSLLFLLSFLPSHLPSVATFPHCLTPHLLLHYTPFGSTLFVLFHPTQVHYTHSLHIFIHTLVHTL